LGYPAPGFLAYLVSGVEVAGVVLLTLGLFTRLIALPLMIIMLIAILTVHLHNGFDCAENGFEIPLYFLMMLGTLFSGGSGRYSLDHLFFKGV
jgi:putative oxidoreductase